MSRSVRSLKVTRAVRRRRSIPIHGYVGANGGGKSLAMVLDTLPSLAAGRMVLSTVKILDAVTGLPHPLWEPLDSYRKLADADRCDVLLDEVNGVASSRQSMNLPNVIESHLVQLRRGDVALRWTAPSWKRADTIIRECSQGVTICKGKMGVEITDDDGTERIWESKRLFVWKTYDGEEYEEWSQSQAEKLKPIARQLFWRPRSFASLSYDTFDAVERLGTVTESNRCIDCGGTKRAPKCECDNHRRSTAVVPAARGPQLVTVAETDETPAVSFEFPDVPAQTSVLSL